MKLKIDPKIFEKFPGLLVGVVSVKGADNNGIASGIAEKTTEQEARIRREFQAETLSQTPKIDSWRKAYAAFGGKPKENRSSVENLYRLVLKGSDLRHINKLVDIYNLVSLKHMLPLGGEDLDKTKGDITLTFATAQEPSVLLLGDKEARPPHEGEVIYKDSISTICRRWNWREAERTKLTEETRNCVLVAEALLPVTGEELEAAVSELEAMVKKHCGSTITRTILDENYRETEL
ncbi:hypothetical protein HZC09_01110 [Candidatus Micrarchaeota archaeon]|nr:hypothetical protein [Candidatus Micrarchaeota archaeon]